MSDTDLLTRVAVLERDMHHIGETLERIDKRLDRMDGRFDHLNARFDALDSRFDRTLARTDRYFLWLLTFTLGGFVGLLATLAKGFKWL